MRFASFLLLGVSQQLLADQTRVTAMQQLAQQSVVDAIHADPILITLAICIKSVARVILYVQNRNLLIINH